MRVAPPPVRLGVLDSESIQEDEDAEIDSDAADVEASGKEIACHSERVVR